MEAQKMRSAEETFDDLKEMVRERYARAARSVSQPDSPAEKRISCCGDGVRCSDAPSVDLTAGQYSEEELASLPDGARMASLGCGNPTALAELRPGETVLDLGSGGGIDVLLSARRVGPEGKAYGLDMTDEMLELARENQRKSGLANVEFLKGDIEAIPLPDAHVDVVISNCVINLATDKGKVFHEAYRVLKPGGRFAVADVLFVGDRDALPADLLNAVEMWAGCVAGALTEEEYRRLLGAAGFQAISIDVIQRYGPESLPDELEVVEWPKGRVELVSAFVRAVKPASAG